MRAGFLVSVVAAALLTSCWSSPTLVELPAEPTPAEGDGVQVETAPVEEPPVTASLSFSAADLDGELTDAQRAEALGFWQYVLDVRDDYWLGEVDDSELAALVIDRDEIIAAAEYQVEYLKLLADEAIIATTSFASFQNATNVRVDRNDIVFDDCTEVQSLSAMGFVGFRWIDQTISIGEIDGRWVVRQVDIHHEGYPFSGEYGCAPPSFAERALVVAETFMAEVDRYDSDPFLVDGDSFAIIDDEITRRTFLDQYEVWRDEDRRNLTGRELSYRVLGINVPASLVDWLVGVEVCVTLPEGMVQEVAGEQAIIEGIEPGDTASVVVIASLEQVEVGAVPVDAIRSVLPGGTGC